MEESEKRFRALVTAMSDVVYRMSPDWSTMYEMDGRGFLANTAGPRADWMEQYIHPEDKEKVNSAFSRAIQDKSIFELEHRVLRADGTVGWTFSRSVPIKNNDGEIIEWFGAATDITARKEAVQELENVKTQLESVKQLYEAIANNTPDLVYVFNLDYTFLYANKALLNMWGKTQEEAFGQGLRPLGYEEWHAAMHEREIDHIVATKEQVRGVVSFPHATLGRRMYDYILVPVLDEHGDVRAVAGTTRDISDLKQAQDALAQSEEQYRNLSQSLEGVVAERTQELQRSNDDLLQFAHVASHDLKEPVRKIKTFVSRLEKELGDDGLNENSRLYLSKIYSATARMNTMIDGVLKYSTLGNVQEEIKMLELGDIIKSIEADLEVPITQNGVTINYKDLPSFEASPVFYQLFYNLINNSLKFARKDVPLVINIGTRKLQKNDNEYLEIKVSDNGIGFPQEFAERIFDTFTRLNPKDHYEGTGLGLSLCKKIAERHGGTITANGEEGKGAEFIITLPVKQLASG